jgi:hypothetical protein
MADTNEVEGDVRESYSDLRPKYPPRQGAKRPYPLFHGHDLVLPLTKGELEGVESAEDFASAHPTQPPLVKRRSKTTCFPKNPNYPLATPPAL